MNTILRYRVTVGSLAFFQSFVSEGHANSHVACLWRTLCVTSFCVDVLYLSQSVSILTEQTAAGLGEIMLFKASTMAQFKRKILESLDWEKMSQPLPLTCVVMQR